MTSCCLSPGLLPGHQYKFSVTANSSGETGRPSEGQLSISRTTVLIIHVQGGQFIADYTLITPHWKVLYG